MSDYARCGVCRGTKKVTGLGGMVKNCLNCKGVGFVGTPPSKPAPEAPKVLCAHCKRDVDWAKDLEKVAQEITHELGELEKEINKEIEAPEPGIYQGKKKGPKPKVQSA
jgi:hypothetical protein